MWASRAATRRVEHGLRRAGVSGHEPSLRRRREVALDECPFLRRRLRVKPDEAGDQSASDIAGLAMSMRA